MEAEPKKNRIAQFFRTKNRCRPGSAKWPNIQSNCIQIQFVGLFRNLRLFFSNSFRFRKLLVVVVFSALRVLVVFFCQIFTSYALFLTIWFQFGCPSCAHPRLSLGWGRLGIQNCTHPLLLTKCSQLSCRAWGRGARGKRGGFSPEAAAHHSLSARVTLTVPNLCFSKKNSARESHWQSPSFFFSKQQGSAGGFSSLMFHPNLFYPFSNFMPFFHFQISCQCPVFMPILFAPSQFSCFFLSILFVNSFNHFKVHTPVFALSEFHSFCSRYLFSIFFDILMVQKWHINEFAKCYVLPNFEPYFLIILEYPGQSFVSFFPKI